MYEVTIRNGNVEQTIHESNTLFTNRKLASCKIEEEKNAISSLHFTIYQNNDGYDSLNVYKTKVYVYNIRKQRYDFGGRVIQIIPCMDSDGLVYKTVVCESHLGYLCDTIQPPMEPRWYSGDYGKPVVERNGIQEFVDDILANHNSQVDEEYRIYRGNVTIVRENPEDESMKDWYLYDPADSYVTTFEYLKTKLLDVLGGEINVRETDGILYFDYAKELGATRSTTIELGKNMESAQRELDCTNIITRLIPLGAKLGKEQNPEERLTIENIDDGLLYIENETAYGLYGPIYRAIVFDDETDPWKLKERGKEYLEKNSDLMENNTIKALDLSVIGLDIDDFRLYDRYPVLNAFIGLDATMEIVKKTTDIIEPYSSSFEMGKKKVGLSDTIISGWEDSKGDKKQIIGSLTELTEDGINDVLDLVQLTAETQFYQNEEKIAASVSEQAVLKSEYESFSETVKNILQMDAAGTTMIFQTINEAIQEVGNSSESHYAEILKYIRFEDGNIVLGEYSNPLMLKIENDRIAFYQNGVVVAYFNDNKLYVTHGEFTETFKMGKFQAMPRANGNVTWKVVG